MSKIGLHLQRVPSWAPELLGTMPSLKWLKIVHPPLANPFPLQHILGRICLDAEQEGRDNKLIRQGARGAEVYFAQCLPMYRSRSYVEVWEGPNEPPVREPEERARLVEFTLRWTDLMHGEGLKVAALSLSVGWPDLGESREFADVVKRADYIGLHAYSAPSMQDRAEHYTLRYRIFVGELAARGVAVRKIFLSEAGIDGGCIGEGGKGWKTYASLPEYFQQILWMDTEVSKDACIESFMPFTTGPYGGWLNYNFNEELVKLVRDHQAGAAPIPPAPPAPAPPVDISRMIREGAWNEVEINYNPEAALAREARRRELGAPETDEFDIGEYRAQGFNGGILYCEVPRWHQFWFVTW